MARFLFLVLLILTLPAQAAVHTENLYTFATPPAAGGVVCLSFNLVAPQKLDVRTCDAACASLGAVCTGTTVSNGKNALRCEDTVTVPQTSCRCCKVAP